MNTMRSLVVGVCAVAAIAAGCSDDSRDEIEDEIRSVVSDAADVASDAGRNAIEVAARNLASAQAQEEFENAGYQIEGDLRCTANADDGLTAVEISCSGTTVDGAAVEMTGTTDELPGLSVIELDGSFVGTVDGEEVFSTDRLGG
jgi:hypothetical protein